MPISEVNTAINSLRAAMDIGRYLIEAKGSIDRVQLNLKLIELADALQDAKTKLYGADDSLRAKDQRIAELEKALALKALVGRNGDAYYETDEDGRHKGAPFCSRCWEVDHKLVHLLVPRGYGVRPCPACKTDFDISSAPNL